MFQEPAYPPLVIFRNSVSDFQLVRQSNQFQNLHSCIWSQHFENLTHIDLGGAVGKATIPKHRPEGLTFGDLLDNGIRDVLVKSGNQVAVVVDVDSAALDLLGCVEHGQAPLPQGAEQQVPHTHT